MVKASHSSFNTSITHSVAILTDTLLNTGRARASHYWTLIIRAVVVIRHAHQPLNTNQYWITLRICHWIIWWSVHKQCRHYRPHITKRFYRPCRLVHSSHTQQLIKEEITLGHVSQALNTNQYWVIALQHLVKNDKKTQTALLHYKFFTLITSLTLFVKHCKNTYRIPSPSNHFSADKRSEDIGWPFQYNGNGVD